MSIDGVLNEINSLQLDIAALSECYYNQDCSPVSDSYYDSLVLLLVELQVQHPDEFKASRYYDAYYDFDGSTGVHLPERMDQYDAFDFRVRDFLADVEERGSE